MKYIHGAGGSSPKPQKQKAPPQPIIEQDDESLRSVSYAKFQFLLCEGEIEGPAAGNSIEGLERSVYLEGTPIRAQGSSAPSPQPEDLAFSWGRGNGAQSGVPDYNRTSDTFAVDTIVEKGAPVSQNVTGSVVGGRYYCSVLLTWQSLFVSIVDGSDAPVSGPTGSVRTYRCEYSIIYTDSNGVQRRPFNGAVDGKFSSTFQRSHEFVLEGVGPTWTVQVIRNTDDDDDAYGGSDKVQASSQFTFSSAVLSLDQKFNYVNSSMLSVGVRADNYSSLPDVSILLKGMKIQVPTNYDPVTRAYSGIWDGTFKTSYTDNPAWVVRDMILNDRYGAGQYIGPDAVDKWTLYEIAKYCDELVPDGNGGNEPRFTCNLLLQSGAEAWEVLQQMSSIFRGIIFYASGLAVSVQDRPKDASSPSPKPTRLSRFRTTARSVRATLSTRVRHAGPFTPLRWSAGTILKTGTRRELSTSPMTRPSRSTATGQPICACLASVAASIACGELGTAIRRLRLAISFKTNELGMAIRPGDVIKIADPARGRCVLAAGSLRSMV